MSDTIWFELAECIGHALAKRWLARRSRQPTNLVTAEAVLAVKPVPESKGAANETGGMNTSQIGSIPSE